jgi:hypothetical protein
MTVHGTDSWNTDVILLLWLLGQKQRLQRVAPGWPLLLVMDSFPVHISVVMLQVCLSPVIALVMILPVHVGVGASGHPHLA